MLGRTLGNRQLTEKVLTSYFICHSSYFFFLNYLVRRSFWSRKQHTEARKAQIPALLFISGLISDTVILSEPQFPHLSDSPTSKGHGAATQEDAGHSSVQ